MKTIKEKKIQYFYKSEFKSLFFKKLRNLNEKNIKKITPKKISFLQKKQVYSFVASAINHSKFRTKIIECIFQNIELDKMERKILETLKNYDSNHLNSSNIFDLFDQEIRQFLKSKILQSSVYTLFPYSGQKYDSELAFQEIK